MNRIIIGNDPARNAAKSELVDSARLTVKFVALGPHRIENGAPGLWRISYVLAVSSNLPQKAVRGSMISPLRNPITWFAWISIFVAGCQTEEPLPPLAVKVPVAPAPAENLPQSPKKAPETPLRTGGPQRQPAKQVAVAETYEPPFPNRVDLFLPPKRAQIASRGSDDEEAGPVELRGIVTPPEGATFAMLAIDGIESPVAEGEEKYGVRVISIEHSEVLLQRGRSRWTETLQ